LTATSEARLLLVSRVVGWALGLLVAAAFVLVFRFGYRAVLAEQHDSEINANAFIEKVRACRRLAPGPMPTWSACEQRVRSTL